jgi:pimeloyl-ACP methyl ester carboxylesterase
LAAQSDDALIGRWSGTLVAGTQQLEIVYHIARAGDGSLTGTMDVPAQGATGIPLTTVSFNEGTLALTFPVPGGGTYEGTLDEPGEGLSGTFSQAGQSFPLNLARTDAPPPPARPQEPEAPFPYGVEEARIDQPAGGFQLVGTLTIPEGAGPFPVAVLVSGSGPQDRDESLLGHKPFWVLADHLTRQGIAVLRYDDRGVGESGGVHATATSEDFASDALAAIAHLRSDPRFDGSRIGIVGHSEGGLVGPMAASRSGDVDYVVMLAGPGVSGLEILVEQGRLINEAAGVPDEITAFNGRIQRRLAGIAAADTDLTSAAASMRTAMREEMAGLTAENRALVEASLTDQAIEQSVAQMNSPWFRFFVHYDPRPALEGVSVPVLALFGEKDLQVPPLQSADAVEAGLSGNADATVEVLPGLNHLFQEAETGSPTEYQAIEQTMSPVALTAVSAWILSRFGPKDD